MYTGTLDPVSNRQDFQFSREIVDDDTNEPVDLSVAVIVLEIREQADDQHSTPPEYPPALLSATTENGKITVIDLGTFQAAFTPVDMRTLAPGYYDIGCTISVNGLTTQLMAATLPVVDGIVA